jgi:RNA polymerase sigma-70 factor (ECF subfamily)
VTGTEPAAGADLELVRLAQAGDERAFGELVERHRQSVYRAAYAALGSAAEAEDAAQEAFLSAYRRLSGFRGESSFRTWILSIAWRKALDRRRRFKRWFQMTATREDFREETTAAIERVPADGPSGEERLAGVELQHAIRQTIASLPRKLRDALLLAGSGEHTYGEIGELLGTPVGTVKWRVSEARRVLKQKLAARGYAYDR